VQPFVFRRGSEIWPPDLALLHVYAVIDLQRNRDLAALIEGCRAATSGDPLTHVGDRWFHITLAQLSIAADQLAESEHAALIGELRWHLAGLNPFTVTAGSPLAYLSGLIFDLGPDEPLDGLRDAVAAAITTARGAEENAYDTGVLHLTGAYSTGEADSDQIQRRLRRVRPSHAPVHIDTVSLVDVHADAQAKTITWRTLADIRLGTLS
jgi:hypothetical protein